MPNVFYMTLASLQTFLSLCMSMCMLNSKTAYTNFLVEATFTCTDMKYIQKEQTNVASYPCVIQVWLLYFYLDVKKCRVQGGDKFKKEKYMLIQ